MVDAQFEHPRLAAVYDALDPDRSDLAVYAAIVAEVGACRVLDVGCGTGSLALLLTGCGGARTGVDVVGVDPAAASLDVARSRRGADRVHWLHGDATTLPPLQVDLATMTGNVAQAIIDPADWAGTLRGVHRALRRGGRLVVETRDPARRAWEEWTPTATAHSAVVPGVGEVRTWTEVTRVAGPLVSFRSTYVFAADGAVLTSDSTLRFRGREEFAADLEAAGLVVDEVRDAPDRPGREFVFVARRPGG